MNCFSIPITQDTYISSNEPFTNYSESEELIISRSSQIYPQINRNNILFKVDLSPYTIKEEFIDRAYICFSISKFTPDLKNTLRKIIAFQNEEDFDYKTVNYTNKPKISSVCNFIYLPPIGLCNVCDRSEIIWDDRCKDKTYICFDITTLVCFWLKNPEKNFGLSLLLECIDSTVIFNSSRTTCGPSLIIKYKKPSNCPKLYGLQLQIANQSGYTLSDEENIRFDTTISNDSRNIIYNKSNGDFTFLNNGQYYVSWWIGIGGSADINGLVFAFEDLAKNQTYIGASEIIISGQISGNAYVIIDDAPKKFRLFNFSGGFVQYSIVPPIQGDITIINFS